MGGRESGQRVDECQHFNREVIGESSKLKLIN